jgi:ferredoxin
VGVRVRVDRQSCQSSGRCVAAAPEAFAFDAEHLAALVPGAPALARERALAIARGCPALAIEVLGEDGAPLDF